MGWIRSSKPILDPGCVDWRARSMQQAGSHPGKAGDAEQSHVTVDFPGEKGERTTNAGPHRRGSKA